MSLGRNGDIDPQFQPLEIDNLVYTYPDKSNQLSKVDENANNTSGFNDVNKQGDDYAYDDNGNMIGDKNKNITAIAYNQLNLPKKITFGTTGTIEYIYNAAGQKLEKIVTDGTTVTHTDYLGGFQYKENLLEFFPTAGGYVKNTAGVLSYVFRYKDHLGNIRVSYAKNPVTNVLEIIEENNYYPFGLKHKGYNDYLATDNKYKYNGKEFQYELGLNMYDYGARNYDPELGRWMNADPLAEKSRRFSPYTYALNNPVYFIDPDGMEAQSPIFDNKTGTWLGNDSTGFMGDEVLFMDADKYKELSKSSENGVIDHEVAVDNSQSISELKATESNFDLFNKSTDFIDKVLYKVFYGEYVKKDLRGGMVQTASAELDGMGTEYARPVKNEFGNYHNNGGSVDTITQSFDHRKTLNTAGNIFSNFEHEFRGHGGRENFNISELPSSKNYDNLEHKAIYKMQMNSSNFKFTSGAYRKHIINKNK